MGRKKPRKPTPRQPDQSPEQNPNDLKSAPPTPGTMASPTDERFGSGKSNASSDDGNANSGPKIANSLPVPVARAPTSTINGPSGQLLAPPTGPDGKPKPANLVIGIKLDLEADIHVNARVRGDILIGLY